MTNFQVGMFRHSCALTGYTKIMEIILTFILALVAALVAGFSIGPVHRKIIQISLHSGSTGAVALAVGAALAQLLMVSLAIGVVRAVFNLGVYFRILELAALAFFLGYGFNFIFRRLNTRKFSTSTGQIESATSGFAEQLFFVADLLFWIAMVTMWVHFDWADFENFDAYPYYLIPFGAITGTLISYRIMFMWFKGCNTSDAFKRYVGATRPFGVVIAFIGFVFAISYLIKM